MGVEGLGFGGFSRDPPPPIEATPPPLQRHSSLVNSRSEMIPVKYGCGWILHLPTTLRVLLTFTP